MKAPRGRFITVEGIDGAGKSTHIAWLADVVRARGHEVILTREPGGTALGEALRPLLLNHPMDPGTEALLMFAARHENLQAQILPALARGAWVISDRFTDATFAYQGAGKGVALARLALLEDWIQGPLQPDLTFLFDIEPAVARARMASDRVLDKFERENAAFFGRIREGYRARALAAPDRIHVLDATASIESIRQQIERHLESQGFFSGRS